MAFKALLRANCRQGRLTITDGDLFVTPRVPVVSRPRWSATRDEISGLYVRPGHGVTLGLAFQTQDGRELHADWLLPHDAQRAAAMLGYHYSLQELRELAVESALGGEGDFELIGLAPAEEVEPNPSVRIVANSEPRELAALPSMPSINSEESDLPRSRVEAVLAGAVAVLALFGIVVLRVLTVLLAALAVALERAAPEAHRLRAWLARLGPRLAVAGTALHQASLPGAEILQPRWQRAAQTLSRAPLALALPHMGRRRVARVGLVLVCLITLIVAAAFGDGGHTQTVKPSPHHELTRLLPPQVLPTATATATALPTATPSPSPTPTPSPTPRPLPPPPPPPPALTLAITCAGGVQNGLGQVCVHTRPGAALTITVTYCDGKKAHGLDGTVHADAAGNHVWRWLVQTHCVGPAVASVTATWNGQTVTISTSFMVRPQPSPA